MLVEFALAAETASCLAIEDSKTGAKSAEAAGCTVLSTDAFVLHHPEAKYFNV